MVSLWQAKISAAAVPVQGWEEGGWRQVLIRKYPAVLQPGSPREHGAGVFAGSESAWEGSGEERHPPGQCSTRVALQSGELCNG